MATLFVSLIEGVVFASLFKSSIRSAVGDTMSWRVGEPAYPLIVIERFFFNMLLSGGMDMEDNAKDIPKELEHMREMPDSALEELAPRQVRSRGIWYFSDKRVNALKFDPYKGVFTARVWGTNVYRLWLRPQSSNFEHHCECPAHAKSGACKHVFASALVLFYLFQQRNFSRTPPDRTYIERLQNGLTSGLPEDWFKLGQLEAERVTIIKTRLDTFDVLTTGILDGSLKQELEGIHWFSPTKGSIWKVDKEVILDVIASITKRLLQEGIEMRFKDAVKDRYVVLSGDVLDVSIGYGLEYDPAIDRIGPRLEYSQSISRVFSNLSTGVIVLEDGNLCRTDSPVTPYYLRLLAGGYEWLPDFIDLGTGRNERMDPFDYNELSLANEPTVEDNWLENTSLWVNGSIVDAPSSYECKSAKLNVHISPSDYEEDDEYRFEVSAYVDGYELSLNSLIEKLHADFSGETIDKTLMRAKGRFVALRKAFMRLFLFDSNNARKEFIQKDALTGAFKDAWMKRLGTKWLNRMTRSWVEGRSPSLVCLPDGENPWVFLNSMARDLAQLWIGILEPENQIVFGNAVGWIPKSEIVSTLQRASVLCKALDAELRFKGKPVEEVPLDIVVEAVEGGQIDWFELKTEIRSKELTIPQHEWSQIVKGERILEEENRIVLPQMSQMEAIRRLSEMYANRRNAGKSTAVEVPRLQVFDWLELRKLGVSIQLPAAAQELFERLTRFVTLPEIPIPDSMNVTLRDYQKRGLDWLVFLYQNRFGACLADDMGLGKTLQAITFLDWVRKNRNKRRSNKSLPCMIVVPPSLIFNWYHECEQFCPDLKVGEYVGPDRNFVEALRNDVVLTTYDIVRRDIDLIESTQFEVLVLDETQFLKNIIASRTKSIQRLKRQFTLCLTGTPMENHVGEYYSIMNLALPGIFGEYRSFRLNFKRDGEQVLRRARPFVLRRTKQEILTELPPKVERDIYLDMTYEQMEIYTRTVGEVRSEVMEAYEGRGTSQAGIVALSALTRLRQVCISPELLGRNLKHSAPKIEYLLGRMVELHDEGYSALLFSQFTRTLDLLEKSIEESDLPFLRLDGKTPTAKRKSIVSKFQNSKTPIFFLISLKAGGVGLNLTKANYVFHADPWWNPAVENQASDRAHRIGQESTVFVQRLIMRHSIEEKMMELKKRKQALFDAIVGNPAAARIAGQGISREDFDFLLG